MTRWEFACGLPVAILILLIASFRWPWPDLLAWFGLAAAIIQIALVARAQSAEPWTRLRQATAIVLWLAVGIVFVTRLSYHELRQSQPAAQGTTQRPASTSAVPSTTAATATGLSCTSQETSEHARYLSDGAVLADGGTNVSRCFTAESPWHLEATGTDGQLCDTAVLNSLGTRIHWARGASFQIHKRESGRFKLHLAQHCRVIFHPGPVLPQQLPLRITQTAQGGATPVFQSTSGFAVTPSTRCRARVFRSFDGSQVQNVAAGARTEVLDTGLFWVESEHRNCWLRIDNAH